ncbi:Ethanolamine kinase 2 [Toxocara canis]|uniref:ethanolamine kinase n=1 Tax=Toxocara canis TaxID=6265 RepID=A0A0B2VMW5_TOXCA|nr:Ethanolamine kinase 2 [Toxocara canis]
MCADLPFFDIELPLMDNLKLMAMAKEILSKLKPSWHCESVSFKFFTAGITNKIFCVTHPALNSFKTDEKVIFRVFGRNTEKIINRKAEVENWLRLAEVGCAAPLFAKFLNGIVCGYLDGEALTVANVRDDKIVTSVFAEYHFNTTISYSHRASLPTGRVSERFMTRSKLENFFPQHGSCSGQSWSKQQQFDEFFTKNDISLRKDFIKLQELINALPTRVVFCHNDLLVHNILYDSKSGKVSFIDYEYAGFNYQGFDIANHFCEYAGMPSTIDAKALLRLALERAAGEVLAAHFFWSAWALVQSQNSIIDFDYLGYAIVRYKMFRSLMHVHEGA